MLHSSSSSSSSCLCSIFNIFMNNFSVLREGKCSKTFDYFLIRPRPSKKEGSTDKGFYFLHLHVDEKKVKEYPSNIIKSYVEQKTTRNAFTIYIFLLLVMNERWKLKLTNFEGWENWEPARLQISQNSR